MYKPDGYFTKYCSQIKQHLVTKNRQSNECTEDSLNIMHNSYTKHVKVILKSLEIS